MKIYYRDSDTVLSSLQREGHLTKKYILTDEVDNNQALFFDFVDALFDALYIDTNMIKYMIRQKLLKNIYLGVIKNRCFDPYSR